MPRLSQELRERAIGMLQANMNVTTVPRTLGCKRLAIHRLRRHFQMTGSTKDRPRSGRPKVTSPADNRFIRLRHLCDRFLPATSSTNVVQGRRVSVRTIQRRLNANGLRPQCPYKGLILTNRHRQERLRWCRARLRWRLNNEWSHVFVFGWIPIQFISFRWSCKGLSQAKWKIRGLLCSRKGQIWRRKCDSMGRDNLA